MNEIKGKNKYRKINETKSWSLISTIKKPLARIMRERKRQNKGRGMERRFK